LLHIFNFKMKAIVKKLSIYFKKLQAYQIYVLSLLFLAYFSAQLDQFSLTSTYKPIAQVINLLWVMQEQFCVFVNIRELPFEY